MRENGRRERRSGPPSSPGYRGPRGVRAHLGAPLFRNAYFLILGAGAGAGLGFVFWGLAARRYSAHDVGVNSAVLAAMMFVSGICQLGLNAVLFRYLPRAGASIRRVVIKTYALTGALSVLAASGAALTSTWWAPALGFLANNPWWFSGFVVATTAWTIFSLQDNVVAGLRQTHWVAIEDTTFSAAKLVLLLALAAAAPGPGIFLAWNVPVLVSLVPVNALIFARLVPRHLEHAGTDSAWDGRKIIRFASGNYVGQLFALASTTLLPIVVAVESGATATAYFYVPWAISTGVQVIAANMTLSLTVEVAFDESKLHDYARRVVVQTMRIVVPLALVLCVASPYVLRLFGSSYAHGGSGLLRLLSLALIPNVIVALGLSIARIRHDARMVILIQAAVCVPIVAISVLLLHPIGVAGVGIACLIGQSSVAVWLMFGILRPVLLGGTPRPASPETAASARDAL